MHRLSSLRSLSSRRAGLLLAIAALCVATAVADKHGASASVADMSVGEIENRLQVRKWSN